MVASGRTLLVAIVTLVAFSGRTQAWDKLCGRTLADMLSLVCHGRGYYTDVSKHRIRLPRETIFQTQEDAHKFFGASVFGERTQRRRGSGLIVAECCEKSCDYATIESYCAPWPKDMDPALRFAGFKYGSWEDEDYYRKYHPEEFTQPDLTTWIASTDSANHDEHFTTVTPSEETTSSENGEHIKTVNKEDDTQVTGTHELEKDHKFAEYWMNEDKMSRKHKKAKRLMKERRARKSRTKKGNNTKSKSILGKLVENMETESPTNWQRDGTDERWWTVEDPHFQTGETDENSSNDKKTNGNNGTKWARKRRKDKPEPAVSRGRQRRSAVLGHRNSIFKRLRDRSWMVKHEARTHFSHLLLQAARRV